MGCLTKEEILRKEDTKKRERVDIPEWGADAHVFVRVITADERDALEVQAKKSRVGLRAFFAGMCLCDADGNDLFNGDEWQQLRSCSGAALDRILEVGQRLNGLTQEAVADAEKNSETTP